MIGTVDARKMVLVIPLVLSENEDNVRPEGAVPFSPRTSNGNLVKSLR